MMHSQLLQGTTIIPVINTWIDYFYLYIKHINRWHQYLASVRQHCVSATRIR